MRHELQYFLNYLFLFIIGLRGILKQPVHAALCRPTRDEDYDE